MIRTNNLEGTRSTGFTVGDSIWIRSPKTKKDTDDKSAIAVKWHGKCWLDEGPSLARNLFGANRFAAIAANRLRAVSLVLLRNRPAHTCHTGFQVRAYSAAQEEAASPWKPLHSTQLVGPFIQ